MAGHLTKGCKEKRKGIGHIYFYLSTTHSTLDPTPASIYYPFWAGPVCQQHWHWENMSELVATKCRRATIALSVASRLFHIARLARIARWSMVPDDAGNSRRRIIRPQSLASILLSSSTIFFQLSYLWSLSQKHSQDKSPSRKLPFTWQSRSILLSVRKFAIYAISGTFPTDHLPL